MTCSGKSAPAQNPHPERIAAAILLYVFGIVMMLVTDAQKFFTLRLKRGLLSDGMFDFSRNINYLGEILLYASFNVIA